jgi:hypothetical protein
MRRGCIAVGLINCAVCGNIIEHGDRYLIIEDEPEPKQRICLTCCEKHNYGRFEIEKGERIFTLLVDESGGVENKKKVEKPAVVKEETVEVKAEKETKKKSKAVATEEKPKKKGAKNKQE